MTGVDSDGLPWEAVFQKNVKTLRERRGWSQTELAKRLSSQGLPFHQQQVQRIETGARPVRLNEAMLLAKTFGVSWDDMTQPADARSLRNALLYARSRASEVAGRVAEDLSAANQQLEHAMVDVEDQWDAYREAVAQDGETVDADFEDSVSRDVESIREVRAAAEGLLVALANLGHH